MCVCARDACVACVACVAAVDLACYMWDTFRANTSWFMLPDLVPDGLLVFVVGNGVSATLAPAGGASNAWMSGLQCKFLEAELGHYSSFANKSLASVHEVMVGAMQGRRFTKVVDAFFRRYVKDQSIPRPRVERVTHCSTLSGALEMVGGTGAVLPMAFWYVIVPGFLVGLLVVAITCCFVLEAGYLAVIRAYLALHVFHVFHSAVDSRSGVNIIIGLPVYLISASGANACYPMLVVSCRIGVANSAPKR